MQTTGLLKNWSIQPGYYQGVYATGDIYNDNKKRFTDGSKVTTSRVLKFDVENGLLYTENSIYKLDIKK